MHAINPEDLSTPYTAALFDARLTLDMLLTGQHGDADPARLLASAMDAIRAAQDALGTKNPA